MPPSDAELLERWRHGDKSAGAELFERYFAMIERFFLNKAPDHVDDLVQETFLSCLKNRDQVKDNSKFRSHLFAIAHHVLGTHLRTVYSGRGNIDLSEISIHDLAPDPWSLIAHREEQRLLLEALRNIPVEHQVLLELRYWESMTSDEIAEVLAIPVGTIRGRLQRARALLTQAMEQLADSAALLESTRADLLATADGMPQRNLKQRVFRMVARRQFNEAMEGLARGEMTDEFEAMFAYSPAGDLSTEQGYAARTTGRTSLEQLDTVEGAFLDGGPELPRVRMELVLDGDLTDLDPKTRQQILAEAREKAGDPQLAITSILPGSILLELDISTEAAATLEKLFKSGDLETLGGFPIRAIRRAAPALAAAASAAVPEAAEAALSDFLVSAFAADELRRLVHTLSDGARLEAALPGAPASLSHLASEAVRLLVRHGLADATLFDKLEAERPRRCDEIRQIRQRFEGISNTGPHGGKP